MKKETNLLGTSLVEILVYIACTVLTCSLAGQLAYTVSKNGRERSRHADAWIQIALALHQILDDIKLTSSDPLIWKKRDASNFIFSRSGIDCGWCIERGRLVRITGIYNSLLQSWSKRATSVILDAVELLEFDYRYSSQAPFALIGIRTHLAMKNGTKIISLDGFAAIPKEPR